MTYTLFTYNGNDGREEDVIVAETDKTTAREWWVEEYGSEPQGWTIDEYEDEDVLLEDLNNVEVPSDGIGAPDREPLDVRELRRGTRSKFVQRPTVEQSIPDQVHDDGIDPGSDRSSNTEGGNGDPPTDRNG